MFNLKKFVFVVVFVVVFLVFGMVVVEGMVGILMLIKILVCWIVDGDNMVK